MNPENTHGFLRRMQNMLRVTVAMCAAALIVLPFHVLSSDKSLDKTDTCAQAHTTACEAWQK